MALSEHEKKVLDELGRQFDAEDPKFARSLGPDPAHGRSSRRMFVGVLVALAGIGLLLSGVGLDAIPLGVAGFLLMIGGAYCVWRAKNPAGGTVTPGKASTSFIGSLKDHWEGRRHVR